MEFTGERYIPELDVDSEISIYHLQRYMSILDICKNKDVLDAASGEGYGSRMIADAAKSVCGLDISEDAINNAKAKYEKDNLHYEVGSVEKLPYLDDSFDVVISFETIEHVPEAIQESFLDEIKRVLRKDGILVMSSPDKKNYSDIPKFNNEYHVHELYKSEFEDKINSRFVYANYYYQGTFCNSYIFDDKDKNLDGIKSIKLRNPDETRAEYIVCVCSDCKIDASIISCIQDVNNRYYLLNDEIKLLKERLGEPGKIIEQKENYIIEQRNIISDRDNQIRELNGIIEQKENYINEQRDIIYDIENENRKLNGVVQQKESYINEQRNELNHVYMLMEQQDNEVRNSQDFRKVSGKRHLLLAASRFKRKILLSKKPLGHSKLKIGVLNAYIPTLGGGEKHMGYLCAFLEDYYQNNVDIDIIVYDYNNINVLAKDYTRIKDINKQFGLNLKKTRIRKLDLQLPPTTMHSLNDRQYIEEISAQYDIFIDFCFQSKHIGKAKYNIYEVMFPPRRMEPLLRPYPSFKAAERQHDQDFIDSYDLFISNSEYTSYWTEERWQVGDRQCVIYPPVFSEKEIEGLYQEQKKQNIIMSVGRFFVGSHSKKQLDLVKFFVGHQEVFKDYEYHLCGAISTMPEDVAYLEEIKKVASEVNNVFIHENCPFDLLMDLYSRAKIFWHATGYGVDETIEPEKMEHFGITPVEAMSYGVIPVVINKGGPKETVVDGKIGYCWSTEEECVEKTKRLIDDDNLRREMAELAIERAKEYSIEKFYERHKAVFDEIQL